MIRPKFDYSRLFRPTLKQQQENIAQLKEYEHLGIRFGFSENIPYTSDEIEAVKCISINRPLSTDLEQRLIQTREQRLRRTVSSYVPSISDKEVLQTLGMNKF